MRDGSRIGSRSAVSSCVFLASSFPRGLFFFFFLSFPVLLPPSKVRIFSPNQIPITLYSGKNEQRALHIAFFVVIPAQFRLSRVANDDRWNMTTGRVVPVESGSDTAVFTM